MLRKLLALVSFSIVSFGSAVLAQQPTEPLEKVLPIRGFGGLNTISGLFLQKPNDASIAINFDLSKNMGSLEKRLGVVSVDTLNGIDSILAVGVANISDGRQYLAYVIDDSNTAYGSIRIGKKNSVNLDSLTTIFSRFPTSRRPNFTLFKDELYITNENGRAIHYKNGRAFLYPPLSPGEPYILPLVTAGNVNGTVRYVFIRIRAGNTATTRDVGYVSQPVRVKNQQVLITGFAWQPPDSFINTTAISDTIEIWRTRGDVQPLDQFDSVWSTGLKVVLTQTTDKFSVSATDNVSEATLTAGTPMLISTNGIPVGSVRIVRPARFGAPGWVKSDSANLSASTWYTSNYSDNNASKIWWIAYRSASSSDTNSRVLGWKWNATTYDTLRDIESDTSPGLVWLANDTASGSVRYQDSTNRDRKRKAAVPYIVLPQAVDSHSVIRLYRSAAFVAKYDTTLYKNPRTGGVSKRVKIDSITFTGPRLIGEYSKFDTIRDTLRYDSLLGRARWFPTQASGVAPYQNGLVQLGSRLWGFYGSRVFFSSIDSGYRFDALNSISLTEGDGDIITAILPTEDGLTVFKSKSMYLIYPDGNGSFTRNKVAANVGCVSAKTIAKTGRGVYFLAEDGVYRQTSGQYREAAPQLEKVSQKLPQLGRFSSTRKSKAVAAGYDEKYLISFGDTTYVYAENTGEWSTWEFGIQDIVKFAVEDNQTFLPLDSLYFLMSSQGQTGVGASGRRIWRYGPGEIDSGYQSNYAIANGPPTLVWRTAPLLAGPGYKSITKIGFYGSGGVSDQFTVKLYDESTTEVASIDVSGISGKYQEIGFPPTTAKFYQIQIQSSGITSTGRTIFDGMDVYYIETGNVEIK